MFDLINIISIVTACQLLLFAVFVFTQASTKSNHLLLGFFLLSNSFYILGFIVHRYVQVYPAELMNFLYFGIAFGFLFGPLLFLYTKSITVKDFSFKKSYLLHALLFLIYIFAVVIFFHVKDYDEKLSRITEGILIRPREFSIILVVVMHIQILIYLFMCFKAVHQFRNKLQNYYSQTDTLKLSWMRVVLVAFLFMWLADISNFSLIRLGMYNEMAEKILTTISLAINFVFANLILFKGLKQPQYFTPIIKPVENTAYENSPLRKEKSEEYLRQLKQYMEKEKPYLEPELTLDELASKLGVLPKFLSQAINQNLKKNFYYFINEYRIEEAKKLLQLSNDSRKTILEILYACGFNSKSTFNSAFKKYEGVTPKQFKQRLQSLSKSDLIQSSKD
jgi:AraC-like DNA-binding protein